MKRACSSVVGWLILKPAIKIMGREEMKRLINPIMDKVAEMLILPSFTFQMAIKHSSYTGL